MSEFLKKINSAVLLVLLLPALAFGAETAGRTRLIFIGDIMAHAEQLERPRSSGTWDFSPQFRRVKPLFADALVVGNLETVFAGGTNFTGYPAFNTPDGLADALVDLGVNVVTLANNHIMDKGAAGAIRTTEVLDGAGLLWTGLAHGDTAPNSALPVEYGEVRVAFVNYSYGSNRSLSGGLHMNTISDEAVLAGLRDAALQSPDITVACFHWGNEYQYTPTKRQRAVAELCFSNGADLVIGTHPHVLQPVEVVDSASGARAAVYSLGNFISYQRTRPRERSVILAVDFEKSPERGFYITRLSVAPTWVSVARDTRGRLIEAVYAGESPRFNHAGLSVATVNTARANGRAVLEFLGARGGPDPEGFYTIWDAASPDVTPKRTRKAPM